MPGEHQRRNSLQQRRSRITLQRKNERRDSNCSSADVRLWIVADHETPFGYDTNHLERRREHGRIWLRDADLA